MNAGRKTLLIALAVAIAAVAALSAGVLALRSASTPTAEVSSSEQQKDPSAWKAAFEDCANGTMTTVVLYEQPVQECITTVMKSAIDASAIGQLNEAILLTERAHSAFFSACHDAGHKAGRYFYEKAPDISARLTENRSSACLYALGHGILDGFAAAKPPVEEFRLAAQTCERLIKEDNGTFGLCADGLGHVAWSSTKDVDGAVERCDVFTVPLNKEACGEGVIMQIFEPAGFLPSSDIARAPEELPAMCEAWDTSSPELKKGCYKGAGYIYTRPAWVLQAEWTSRNGTEIPDKEMGDRLVTAMQKAADQCREHPTKPAVSGCLYSVSQQTPHIAYMDPDLLQRVCEPQGQWAERCRTWRHVSE